MFEVASHVGNLVGERSPHVGTGAEVHVVVPVAAGGPLKPQLEIGRDEIGTLLHARLLLHVRHQEPGLDVDLVRSR